jgi:DNA modification methylase
VTKALTRSLGELESVIERGFSTFIEVGTAIAEIRDRELYKKSYPTFEDYMRERWGWGRSTGYRQIKGAQIGLLLVENVADRLHPTHETQVRPLSRLASLPDFDEGMQIDAWNEAAGLANEGKEPKTWHPPTEAFVKAVVNEMMGGHEEPPTNFGHVQLLQGRMEDWLPGLGKFPCIVTDPPYGTTAHDWDKAEHEAWLSLLREALEPSYSMFWFCPASLVADTELLFRRLGMAVQSRIVWHRRNMALGSAAKTKFIDTWEMAFHVGNRDLNFPSDWGDEWFDVQTFPVPQSNFDDKKLHPTQKPLELISRLVRFGSFPGERVLDPFAGSGTTGAACPEDRSCVLIERAPQFVQVIEGRLGVTTQTRKR